MKLEGRQWNTDQRKQLVLSIGLALALVLGANAFLFLVSPPETPAEHPVFLDPPGSVVGTVWILLFVAMGTARWLVDHREGIPASKCRWVLWLMLFCTAYPFYTLALRSVPLVLFGNFATIVFALIVALQIRKVSRLPASLVLPTALWVSFATFLTVEQLKRSSL